MLKLSLMLSVAFALTTGIANAQIIETDVVDVNLDPIVDTTIVQPAVVGGSGCCGTTTVLTQPAVVEPVSTCGVMTQHAVVEPVSTCGTVITQPAVLESCDPCARTLTQSAVIAPMQLHNSFLVPAPRIYDRDNDGLFGILNPLNWFD